MEYRELGKTGERCSIIGLGCEHLDGKAFAQVQETIDAALENGVNILDVFRPWASRYGKTFPKRWAPAAEM